MTKRANLCKYDWPKRSESRTRPCPGSLRFLPFLSLSLVLSVSQAPPSLSSSPTCFTCITGAVHGRRKGMCCTCLEVQCTRLLQQRAPRSTSPSQPHSAALWLPCRPISWERQTPRPSPCRCDIACPLASSTDAGHLRPLMLMQASCLHFFLH
jgi:hypothetical protein